MKPLDTANTYRKYAVLDSDAEMYELAVRLFFPKEAKTPKPFSHLKLRDKVMRMTGCGWYVAMNGLGYALRLMLDAEIIAPHPEGFITTAPRNDERVARLLRYQYQKIEKLQDQIRDSRASVPRK